MCLQDKLHLILSVHLLLTFSWIQLQDWALHGTKVTKLWLSSASSLWDFGGPEHDSDEIRGQEGGPAASTCFKRGRVYRSDSKGIKWSLKKIYDSAGLEKRLLSSDLHPNYTANFCWFSWSHQAGFSNRMMFRGLALWSLLKQWKCTKRGFYRLSLSAVYLITMILIKF